MPTMVDLINQVQKILPVAHGGTGNDEGYATERVILPYMNDTGGALALGTLVKLYATYDDRRVIPTTTLSEPNVTGVVVGRFILSGETAHQFEEVAPANQDTVAVCVVGRCNVLVASAVNIGEFATASNTDGQAESSTIIATGTIGIYESSTAGSGTAAIRLWGNAGVMTTEASIQFRVGDGITNITAGYLDDVPDIPFNCTITGVTMVAKSSGSVTIDVLKSTYAGYPGSLTSIVNIGGGGIKPFITTGVKYQDTALAVWTVDMDEGDVLRCYVDSASGISQLSIGFRIIRR
jgi:hypothetical protein